ncbi:hypothetical protein GGI42DRAFT_355293 [Trichoderma sp. SZMC 28013]
MVLDIGPGIKLESNGAREDVEHRTTRLAFRRSSSMVSRHVMAWRPGMNCSPAAGIHVKRRRRITPSPLDDGAANAGTAWFQGRNSYSGPVDFLEGFFNTLVGQEKSEFQYPVPGLVAASRIHTPVARPIPRRQARSALPRVSIQGVSMLIWTRYSILDHLQFRRSIPGIRAHDKSVLDREHELRIDTICTDMLQLLA